jgi:hypothetical protein
MALEDDYISRHILFHLIRIEGHSLIKSTVLNDTTSLSSLFVRDYECIVHHIPVDSTTVDLHVVL